MTTDTQPTARLRTAPRDDAPSLMLAAVCAVAVLNGISTIVVTYDGCGDEGQIHSIVLQGPADHDGTAPELPMPEMPCTSWCHAHLISDRPTIRKSKRPQLDLPRIPSYLRAAFCRIPDNSGPVPVGTRSASGDHSIRTMNLLVRPFRTS